MGGLCLVLAIAAVLFLSGSRRSSAAEMKNIGGQWFIQETSKSLPEPGPIPRYVYRARNGRRVLVDEAIGMYRFYEPDCVIYETAREEHHVFAVCGDRVPVGIASANVSSWKFDDDGVRRVSEAELKDGNLVQKVEVLPIEDIKALAKGQPPFHSDWAKSVTFDVANPPLVPVEHDIPVDVRAKSRHGTTPLLDAVRSHRLDVIDAVLRAGAGVNAGDGYGTTPLMIAASNGDMPALDRLIEGGANVNAQDAQGTTALMFAAGVGEKEAVKRLLAAGADASLRDSENRTAAQRTLDHEMLDLFRSGAGRKN